MKKYVSIVAVTVIALGINISLAMVGAMAQSSGSGSELANKAELEQVHETQFVCMITDRLFAEEQIEVGVEGKTYYGCCQMCVKKLNNNPNSRTATDPVSGAEVNKAEAVIAADDENKIYYFESVETMKAFKTEQVDI